MNFRAPDIGIDLGTSNTLIYVRNRGVVISEPTVVVHETGNKRNVAAVGDEARYLIGRTTEALTAVQPLRGGTMDDYEMTEALLRYFIRKAIGVSFLSPKPRVCVAVPCSLQAVARKALQEAVKSAGAKQVFLVEKPYAAAIGSGLPVYEPTGSMVVDIGGGTTDVALVSLGGIVCARSIPVGSVKMDEAVAGYIRRESNMLVNASTAEAVKIDLGSAVQPGEVKRIRIRGRDTIFNTAKDIEFNAMQCYEALREPCQSVLAAIKWVLERTPPELACDVMRNGIYLTGGGSQLSGLDQFIATGLGIPVLPAREPGDCTIMGLGYLVENIHLLSSMARQTKTAEN